eukprot:Gb_29427 [translate_table: standard]
MEEKLYNAPGHNSSARAAKLRIFSLVIAFLRLWQCEYPSVVSSILNSSAVARAVSGQALDTSKGPASRLLHNDKPELGSFEVDALAVEMHLSSFWLAFQQSWRANGFHHLD